jgi:hypothetical protein
LFREIKTSLKSDFTINNIAVYITAVPSSTPHSFTIFIVIAMVETWLVGVVDDTSILVEIFSAAFFIF